MKNQNIWIKRSAIYFYFFFSSIGFASDIGRVDIVEHLNNCGVKHREESNLIEQPMHKRRNLTEDKKEGSDTKTLKEEKKESDTEISDVLSLIRSLKISWKEQDAVFVLNISDFYIEDFFRDNFFDVLKKLPATEKRTLFKYLFQDLTSTMDIGMKQFRYNIKENVEWGKSPFSRLREKDAEKQSNIYFFKEILDKKEQIKLLRLLAESERKKTVPVYFFFAQHWMDNIPDMMNKVREILIAYHNELNDIRDRADKVYTRYMRKITKILNKANVHNQGIALSISKMNKIQDFYESYVKNIVPQIKDWTNKAYMDCIDNIVEIYKDEMMGIWNAIDMKLLSNKVKRRYEAYIKKAADMSSVASMQDVIKIKGMMDEIRKENQSYFNDMYSISNNVYYKSKEDIEKMPDIVIFSVALMRDVWKYQKIALIPNDIHDFDLVYAIAEEPFKKLSLKFDSTAKKSRIFRQLGVDDRDDYLLDLMKFLNLDLYGRSETSDFAMIEMSKSHSFPCALAKRLREISKKKELEEEFDEEEYEQQLEEEGARRF